MVSSIFKSAFCKTHNAMSSKGNLWLNLGFVLVLMLRNASCEGISSSSYVGFFILTSWKVLFY